jgi:hypothetical protein
MKDMEQFLKLSREHTDVAAVASRWARYQQREADLADAQEMRQRPRHGEMAGRKKSTSATASWRSWKPSCSACCCPKTRTTHAPPLSKSVPAPVATNPHVCRRPAAHVHALRDRCGWKTEIVSESPSELGGYKEVVVRMEGDRCLWCAQVRVRRPPGAAGAGHRNAGPHPHQRLHHRRAGRAGRGRGHQDQPVGPAHRHLPRQRCRWSAHQQDRLGGAHHPHPHRHRGRMPGRAQPAQQQGPRR